MLDVKISEECTKVSICGSLSNVLSDITILLKVISNGIDDKRAKKDFIYSLKQIVNDEIFTKNEKELEEIVKEKQAELEKKKDDFDKELEGIFDKIIKKFSEDKNNLDEEEK